MKNVVLKKKTIFLPVASYNHEQKTPNSLSGILKKGRNLMF